MSALGAKVVIASRRKEVVERTAQEIQDKTGNPVHGYQLDVRDQAGVTHVIDQIEQDIGLPGVFFVFGG